MFDGLQANEGSDHALDGLGDLISCFLPGVAHFLEVVLRIPCGVSQVLGAVLGSAQGLYKSGADGLDWVLEFCCNILSALDRIVYKGLDLVPGEVDCAGQSASKTLCDALPGLQAVGHSFSEGGAQVLSPFRCLPEPGAKGLSVFLGVVQSPTE